MTKISIRLLYLVIILMAGSCFARAGGEIANGNTDDGNTTVSTVNDPTYDHLYSLLAGVLYNNDSGAIVEAFPLPYLAPGQSVSAATISFYLVGVNNGAPPYNLQLYGMKRVSTTSGAPIIGDWYKGTNDTNNTLLDAKFITGTTPVAQTVSYSGANLTTFVQSAYANAAFSGLDLSNSRYIFFRLSPDGTADSFTNYIVGSSRAPDKFYHPLLSLTIANGITNVAGRLQFSFNLPTAATTSAGVYDNTTGKLLRTIWNNVQYNAGTNYGVWDGKDDSGATLATGTNYKIKLIYHNVQYVWDGTVGNTSNAQSGANVYRSYGKIHDMTVVGTSAFFSVAYNELESPFHQFTVGHPNDGGGINFGYNVTDPYSCFYYCTSDATRSYWAKGFGGISASDTYVIAINKSSNTFYTFPNGTAPTGTLQAYSSCIDLDTTANQPNAASGLAVQQSGNMLFVSHSNLNLVRVFDKVQGTSLGSFAVTNPGRLATTANGDVWVISNSSSPTVQRYTFANGSATLKQTIGGFNAPAGVGVSADDSLVLITDGGTSQQIKAYNNATGAALWTYGTLGGMDKNGPTITTNTFDFNVQRANYNDFSNEAFIAFQPDNTFWLQDEGNSRVLHFSINGSTPVYIEQISYNDASYRVTADLSDATRVFNNFLEYSVDYSKPLGGNNGSWTMVKNWGCGLPSDATHFYYGFANGFINVVTLSNGRTYGFLTNFITGWEDLFELPPSGFARFTGYSFDHTPWIYADGTIRFNIANGTNTALAYYSEPLTGFDAKNNPVWGTAQVLASTVLGSTDPIPWTAFPMRTEVTASGIVLDFDANQADSTRYHLAGLPVGGTAFNWRSCPSTSTTISGWFPQDGEFDCRSQVQYAGNHVMALGRNIVYGYHGEFWGGGEASQWLNFYDDGLMVGIFGTYGNANSIQTTTNGFAGNSYSPVLVHAPDGNVYLYHNDEANHGGTCRWHISGWDGITEISGTGAVGSTASLSGTGAPTVSVTSPTAKAAYFNGDNVTLSAEAGGGGAAITKVQFFDGSTSLGSVSVAPYTINYSGLSAGSHSITAQATDASGNVATSAAVSCTVGADGTNTPPATPTVLTTTSVANSSVALSWTQPGTGTTTSTIGQILSFQLDSPSDSAALASTDVAGASPYASSHFNLLGQASTVGDTFINVVNNAGTTLTNLEVNFGIAGSNATNSTESLTGTAQKLFSSPITTTFNTAVAVSLLNVPFATYDVVVYSLPGGIRDGPQTAFVTVSNGSTVSSTVQQTFTKLPTGYTTATVNIGSSTSVTDVNTIIFHGLTAATLEIQGANLAAFQVIERPYDQGAPSSYTIQRATGTGGTFATIGTSTTPNYTDGSVSAGTSYQYRVLASNSFGSSAYSNTISVTTPGVTTGSTTVSSFASWQAKYFTAAQLADATISGPAADPYGSGVPNLLAYALQLDPSTAKPTDVPNPVVVNGHLAVTYFVPTAITDISYIVEVSSNLAAWNSGTGYTQTLSNVTTSTGHTLTVQDTLPTTEEKHFMRLRVTQH